MAYCNDPVVPVIVAVALVSVLTVPVLIVLVLVVLDCIAFYPPFKIVIGTLVGKNVFLNSFIPPIFT